MRYLLIIVTALICGGCANMRIPVITAGMSHGEVVTEMYAVDPPAMEEAQINEMNATIRLYRQVRYDGGCVHIKVVEQEGRVVSVTYLGY